MTFFAFFFPNQPPEAPASSWTISGSIFCFSTKERYTSAVVRLRFLYIPPWLAEESSAARRDHSGPKNGDRDQ